MNAETDASHDVKNDNTSANSVSVLRAVVRFVISLLPANAPVFIYTKLMRPRPLRALGNMLLRRMIPATLSLPEGTLLLNQQDPVVSGALALSAYEPYFTKVLRDSLTPDMTMVDIGANLGYYTLIGSAHAKRVIAFEPEPENATLLLGTVDHNQRANVTLIQKGLGEKESTLPLELHPDNKGKHSLLATGERGTTTTSIALTTLDRALAELHIEKIDLIKMDIEGWEAKALRGAMQTITTSLPIIMFEFTPARLKSAGDDPKALLQSLTDLGYALLEINEEEQILKPIDSTLLLMQLTGWDDYVNIFARPRREVQA